jgi:hypothetical protein
MNEKYFQALISYTYNRIFFLQCAKNLLLRSETGGFLKRKLLKIKVELINLLLWAFLHWSSTF